MMIVLANGYDSGDANNRVQMVMMRMPMMMMISIMMMRRRRGT